MTAGIVLSKKLGDKVTKGDVILTIYTEHPNVSQLLARALNDYELSDVPTLPPKVIEASISYDKKKQDFIISED